MLEFVTAEILVTLRAVKGYCPLAQGGEASVVLVDDIYYQLPDHRRYTTSSGTWWLQQGNLRDGLSLPIQELKSPGLSFFTLEDDGDVLVCADGEILIFPYDKEDLFTHTLLERLWSSYRDHWLLRFSREHSRKLYRQLIVNDLRKLNEELDEYR